MLMTRPLFRSVALSLLACLLIAEHAAPAHATEPAGSAAPRTTASAASAENASPEARSAALKAKGDVLFRARNYVDAVAAYYEDWANRPEKARQAARSKAFEALAAKYPGDTTVYVGLNSRLIESAPA